MAEEGPMAQISLAASEGGRGGRRGGEEHKDRGRRTLNRAADVRARQFTAAPGPGFAITSAATPQLILAVMVMRGYRGAPAGPPVAPPTTTTTTRPAGSFNCQALTFVEQQ